MPGDGVLEDTPDWTTVYSDVSALAGQTFYLNFMVYHDGTPDAWTRLYVDDVGFCPQYPATALLAAPVPQPPAILSVTKLANPFRLKITGTGFQSGMAVAIDGSPWTNVLR